MAELFLPVGFLTKEGLSVFEVVVLNEAHACSLGCGSPGGAEMSLATFQRFALAKNSELRIQRPLFVCSAKTLYVEVLDPIDHGMMTLIECSLLYRLQKLYIVLGSVECYKVCGRLLHVRFYSAVSSAGESHAAFSDSVENCDLSCPKLEAEEHSTTDAPGALDSLERAKLAGTYTFSSSLSRHGVFKVGPSTQLHVSLASTALPAASSQFGLASSQSLNELNDCKLFGMDTIQSTLMEYLHNFAVDSAYHDSARGNLNPGILLYGLAGCGKKSLLAKLECEFPNFVNNTTDELPVQMSWITLGPALARSIGASKDSTNNPFSQWLTSQLSPSFTFGAQPLVLFLPDLDNWISRSSIDTDLGGGDDAHNETGPGQYSAVASATFVKFFEALQAISLPTSVGTRAFHIAVIATASTSETIFNSAEGRQLFYRRLLVSLPDAHSRYNILLYQIHQKLSAQHNWNLKTSGDNPSVVVMDADQFISDPNGNDELIYLASKLHGYTPKDLHRLVQLGYASFLSHILTQKTTHPPTLQDLCAVLTETSRTYLQLNLSQHTSPVGPLHWSDIGGYEEIKRMLQCMVQNRLTNAAQPDGTEAIADAALGLRVPRGILLHGPPGCSKTMFVRALATECQLPLIAVQSSRIFGRYVGDSERNMRQVLVQARASSPAILFIDEIDLLLPSRSSSETGASEHVLGEVLTAMDGVEGQTGQVILVAATNRMDKLDTALSRAGRFDLVIAVPPPDVAARLSILQIALSKRAVAVPSVNRWLERFAETTLAGYTGAEIVHVVERAAELARQNGQTAIDKECLLRAQAQRPPVSLAQYNQSNWGHWPNPASRSPTRQTHASLILFFLITCLVSFALYRFFPSIYRI